MVPSRAFDAVTLSRVLGASAAARLGHGYVGVDHVLLELLEGKPDAVAQAALLAVGVRPDDVERYLEPPGEAVRWISPTPRCTGLMGRAEGLALGVGDGVVRSTDLLIGLLWDDGQVAALDLPGGATREAVAAALAAAGVTLPSKALPSPPTWSDEWTRGAFPLGELDAVLAAMHRHLPDGLHWGWNVDGGEVAWVDAERGVDLQAILQELGLDANVEHHGTAG